MVGENFHLNDAHGTWHFVLLFLLHLTKNKQTNKRFTTPSSYNKKVSFSSPQWPLSPGQPLRRSGLRFGVRIATNHQGASATYLSWSVARIPIGNFSGIALLVYYCSSQPDSEAEDGGHSMGSEASLVWGPNFTAPPPNALPIPIHNRHGTVWEKHE